MIEKNRLITTLGRMNSLWFCCDPEPSIDLKACKGVQHARNTEDVSSPFLGIFTEDPLEIGSRLHRPITPAPSGFPHEESKVSLPPPTHAPIPIKTFKKHDDDPKPYESIVCESPPTHGPFDFAPDSLKGDCIIGIF